jgi:carboxyl-terminal processing protease
VREITVTRDTVEIPNVKHEMLEDGIGRLEVNAFDQNMPGEVREALRDLQNQGLRGLVLDLRRNLGGLITSTVEVSDMFLSGGVIYRLESEKELSPADKKPATAGPEVVLPADVPIVVLTSAGTASAAEILAGSLQAHDRAVLLGAQTMGKGSVNANYSLPDGSAIYITVAHYVLANGRVVESQGLEPDVPFEFQMPTPPEEVRRDPAAGRRWLREQGQAADQAIREKAVELLLQRLDGDDAEEPDTDIETDT